MKRNNILMLVILLMLTFSCAELKNNEDVQLNEMTEQKVKINPNKVRIIFNNSMNVEVVFIDRKVRELKNVSNNIVLDIELDRGEHKLLIQKKNKRLIKSLINIKPGNVYTGSYGVIKERIIDSKTGQVIKEEKKTIWDILGKILSFVAIIFFLLFAVVFPIINFLIKNKDSIILILVVVILIFGLGLLFAALHFIIKDWSPYISLYFIFVPGLYALIIGTLGAIDEGYRIETSHEWRLQLSGNKMGGKYSDATVKDLYEHYHPGKSWEQKIKNRKISLFIFGIILAVIGAIITNNKLQINLFFNSIGFIIIVALGIINYTILCLIFWSKSRRSKIIIFFISILNVFGCVLTTYLI